MRLSHKRKIKAKKQGKLFKSFVLATGGSSMFSLNKSSGKNKNHTFVIGTTQQGKQFVSCSDPNVDIGIFCDIR